MAREERENWGEGVGIPVYLKSRSDKSSSKEKEYGSRESFRMGLGLDLLGGASRGG